MDAKLQRRIQRYGWDRAADAFERAWKDQLEPAQTRMLALAAIRPGDHVLDIACGTGLVTFRAAEMTGPDPNLAVAEMHRTLKRGGTAAAAVWGRRENCGWAAIFSIVDVRVKTEVCPLFFQLGTGESLKRTFERAGLEPIAMERINTILRYGSAEEALVAAFAGGPVALAYSRFDATTREEAHAEYLESISGFRSGDGRYEIPGEFVAVSGKKE